MSINSLTSLPLTASALPGVLARSQSPVSDAFQQILNASASTDRRAQAEEGAAGLVSQALILPILKQLRRSSFNTQGPLSPGTGEKTFGPEFDMQIADRIAHSPRLGIRKALADRLMKKPETAAPNVKAHG